MSHVTYRVQMRHIWMSHVPHVESRHVPAQNPRGLERDLPPRAPDKISEKISSILIWYDNINSDPAFQNFYHLSLTRAALRSTENS